MVSISAKASFQKVWIAVRALELEAGELFANEAEVEIVNGGMFVFHDFCRLNVEQKPTSKVFRGETEGQSVGWATNCLRNQLQF